MSNEYHRGRIKLLLIVLLCATPVAAAYITFYFWEPRQGTMNYGELLPPRLLPDAELQSLDGRPFRISELRGKWLLLQVDSAACSQSCRKKLYFLRQLRLTQGKDMDRIERVWVIDDGGTPQQQLVKEYAGTWLIRDTSGALLAVFPSANSPQDHIYVVDPRGNLMLRFPRNADPRKMIKDISRLLMASQIG